MSPPLNSRHELVRAHVAARAGRARVALEVGRRRARAGARVDAGRAGTEMEVAREEGVRADVATEIGHRPTLADIRVVEVRAWVEVLRIPYPAISPQDAVANGAIAHVDPAGSRASPVLGHGHIHQVGAALGDP